MRARTLVAALAGAASLAALPAAAARGPGAVAALRCVAPADAAGLDAMLRDGGSPLAGHGGAFVSEGLRAGIDPRALVAIAAHETLLETYAPALLIRNPFGLGPGMSFSGEDEAIALAARTLARSYVPEGRDTLETIGAKWAPVGAANDPGGLNESWTRGVGTYYAALGGDPGRPILTTAQSPVPDCGETTPLAPLPAGGATGTPVVTAWGGATPRTAGAGPEGGGDPRGGGPATIEGFVFPLAIPPEAPAVYRDAFRDPGPVECAGTRRQCAVTIATVPGGHAVAAVAGTLRAASPPELEEGIAFWIETAGGDRVGYGPLASYAAGAADGVAVTAGRPLGVDSGVLRVAWTRDGVRIDPFPLLEATRPPTGARA